LLAGFGAVFGLLIANFDSLSTHISPLNIKVGAGFFIVSAALGAAQKFIAAYVAATSASSEQGREIGDDLVLSGDSIDFDGMFREVRRGLFWPLDVINERMVAKAMAGDFAIGARQVAKATQVQLVAMLLQVVISLVSAVVVVCGINL